MDAAPHNVIVLYKEWVNSILCEDGLAITSISQLNIDNILHRLYSLLAPHIDQQMLLDLNLDQTAVSARVGGRAEKVAAILSLLREDGVRVNLQPSDIVQGDFQSLLELVWILLVNYGIHLPGGAKPHQRTLSIGTKLLLQWCSDLLGGVCFDYRLSMSDNMEKDVLHNIINNVTNLVSEKHEPEACDYHEAIAEAESKLGISSNILRVCDNQTEDLAVTVYISLLRRKRELILGGKVPARPTVLASHQETQSTSKAVNNLSLYNDKTQQVLQDIEKQLGLYQSGRVSPLTSVSHRDTARQYDSYHSELTTSQTYQKQTRRYRDISPSLTLTLTQSEASRVPSSTSTGTIHSTPYILPSMPSPIPRAHGSFPNDTNPSLKIDLSQLKSSSSNKPRSQSSTSTPRRQQTQPGGDTGQVNGDVIVDPTADFSALLRQLKEKQGGSDTDDLMSPGVINGDVFHDVDRTSPKSGPNTDEGFGTFTKTTPRGKDSASEGSDDHTDCEVDHLEAEPTSITEWWDRIEMPSITEITTVDASLFTSKSHSATQQHNGDHMTTQMTAASRVNEDGSIGLADDELMCMIDSIGMNGVRASSGLASAQETELRLLHILKERDDLVLSYHGALKELSKLTARIKDENHLLRQQLNMTDLSHSEIVLALEEQASDGRQLAMSLQDDLTDTEINVVSRLRDDKHVLEDRLAALEQQYNTDIGKWKTELSVYKSQAENASGVEQEKSKISRENHILKLQLDEMRNILDVTVSRTQDECHNYLQTIDTLKQQISSAKSPISESQLEALAMRQADMEKLYESMIQSLEGDNSKLQSSLEDLQEEMARLKLEKAKHDKACGTANSVTDSGIGTDTSMINKSMNTSLEQSTKSTTTQDVSTAVKSINTGEDQQLVDLRDQVSGLKSRVSQDESDRKVLEEHNGSLLDNHKTLSERLARVESQLEMSQHKLTTLQAVHELVLSKNESLEKTVNESSSKIQRDSTNHQRIQLQLTTELEKARTDSATLSAELSALRHQVTTLQAENAAYRQREVHLNSELTKLTLERSNLQGKVNSLNADMVKQKGQHMSQTLQIKQLEAVKSKLESEAASFKSDSLDLFKQVERARQDKDELESQLSSLHDKLEQGMSTWQTRLQRQQTDSDVEKNRLEADLNSQKASFDMYRTEVDRLTSEIHEVNAQLRDAKNESERTKQELSDVLRTAKLDKNSDDVIGQLNEQLKSLHQQNAEYRFTTTHFRTENNQLQLRVNQLEEMNQSIDQRNQILQEELGAVQASLDDSFHSQESQLNLLDLSSSDLMSMSDVSELKNYILAAKKQLEAMQQQRAKTNLEYSRKINEMGKLVKNRSGVISDAPSSSDTDSKAAPSTVSSGDHRSSDHRSSNTDFVTLPAKIDMNSSFSSAALATSLHEPNSAQPVQTQPQSQQHDWSRAKQSKFAPMPASQMARSSDAQYSNRWQQSDYSTSLPVANTQLHNEVSSRQPTTPNMSVFDVDGPDTLSLKVHMLTNRPGTSTPTRVVSPPAFNPSVYDRKSATIGGSIDSAIQSSSTHGGHKLSAIESENAALRAELDMINSDRDNLHQHMHGQVGNHDELNTTLDELEKSLEEVYDNNRLLRDTLGDCNDFIQTNLLNGPTHRPHSVTPGGIRPPRSTSMASSMRPHSVTPGMMRPHSVTPVSQAHHTSVSFRPHSVMAGRVSASHDADSRLGWSADVDRQLTSSLEYNKLQQTNVQNYEALLTSDTNTKSPTTRGTSARKSNDLNQMIQHSLTQLNHVNSSAVGSPFGAENTMSAGFTSTPVRSRYGHQRYNASLTTDTGTPDSDMPDRFFTADQFTSSIPADRQNLTVTRGNNSEFSTQPKLDNSKTVKIKSKTSPSVQPVSESRPARTSRSTRLSRSYDDFAQTPSRRDTPTPTRTRRPNKSLEGGRRRSVRICYDDGGPGPNEPKTVLPEPLRTN